MSVVAKLRSIIPSEDDTPLAMGLKVLGVAGTLLATTVAGGLWAITFFGTREEKAYLELLSALDQAKAVTFRSIESCTEQGFPEAKCITSRNNAFAWAGRVGRPILHSSTLDDELRECNERYGGCSINIGYRVPPFVSAKIVGWQAEADDPTQAVPLYGIPNEPEAGVRYDGKRLALD